MPLPFSRVYGSPHGAAKVYRSLKGLNDSGSVFSKKGSTKEGHPSGKKVAKQKQKEEKLGIAYMRSKLEISSSTLNSMAKLADAISRKEKREYLLSMFKVAKDIDDKDIMEDYLYKLKALEKEDASQKPRKKMILEVKIRTAAMKRTTPSTAITVLSLGPPKILVPNVVVI